MSSRTKVGVLPVLDGQSGGIYQYSLAVLDALDDLRDEFEPILVFERSEHANAQAWERAGWQLFPSTPATPRAVARRLISLTMGGSAAERIGGLMRRTNARVGAVGAHRGLPGIQITKDRDHRDRLRRRGIELMLYPAPTTRSQDYDTPYVMAVHDLQHRIHPEFPEVSANGEWDARERLFTDGVRNAEAILVDSETGKEDVLKFYGHLTSPDRIRVLPFIPPPYLVRPTDSARVRVLEHLGIRSRYLLFPAQFWPHKNHRRVTEAIAALHHEGVDVTVVMTGSGTGDIRAGVLADVREVIAREGLQDIVRILGYVDDSSMAALYAGACGVVLPTFFGPTNIPIIEGWAMGVPVLTSDIHGIREQCRDAAILVDPLSVESIKNGLSRLWADEEVRKHLVAAGADRLDGSHPAAFRVELARIISDAARPHSAAKANVTP